MDTVSAGERKSGRTAGTEADSSSDDAAYRAIFETVPQGIIIKDKDGKIILMNPAAEKIVGRAANVLLDSKAKDIEGDTIHEDGSPFPSSEYPSAIALKTGKVVRNVVMGVFNPHDKNYRWINLSAIPLFKQGNTKPYKVYTIFQDVSVVRDITERKKAESALKRTSEYLESLLNYANAPIIVWDPTFKIDRFNHAFERMTGYLAEEVHGKELSMLFPRHTRDESLVKITKTLSGTHWESVEIPIQKKDGDVRVALWNSANIYAEDGKTLIATIAQGLDITERIKAENALREYTQSLAQSNQELQSFAYAASHDLREPLRTISGFLELLAIDYGDALDEKAKGYITRSVDASNRLHLMIDDLLSFSRLETRKKPFELIHLDEILKTALHDLDKTITERGARISYNKLPDIYADDQQMAIVFRNLIDNAIKFRKDDRPEVKISAEKKNDEWLIVFKDNGIGIDSTNYGKIFNMFSRLNSWKEYPGTGIGLAMCKKIVQRHGGRIWVESEKGKGSAFIVALPDLEAVSDYTAH